MNQVGQFASNEAIIKVTASYPVYALNSASDSFEVACEIGIGSVHGWTPEDVVKNDNGLRTLVLGTEIAQALADQGYVFAGSVILVGRRADAQLWDLAARLRPSYVIAPDVDEYEVVAALLRPLLGA